MSKIKLNLMNVPSQDTTFSINGNKVGVKLLTRGSYLYCSISINDEARLNGIICHNKTNIIQYPIKELQGSLYFEDTQGDSDPIYDGLNDRWILIYEE